MLKLEDIEVRLDIIERAKLMPMLSQVNITDFVKCIAQFSGLNIEKLSDDIVAEYLITWAENKQHFFKLLGNSLKKDINFTYKALPDQRKEEYRKLRSKYPVYALWLHEFEDFEKNKIEQTYKLSMTCRNILSSIYPDLKFCGLNITHLFKKYLQAPDELITDIAAIYENKEINSIYTISIDPVDMMLASENPYDWSSCYRLELGNDGSHADGCLAAVLDSTSLISYVWDTEGKFTLYDKYKFKNIRYKRMRQWLVMSKDLKAIHFNQIYPGKSRYGNEFEKTLRDLVETTVSNYLGVKNLWSKENCSDCCRDYYYGYSEFCENIYQLKENDDERPSNVKITVYDEPIYCACGCGMAIPGSDTDEEELAYSGEGFNCKSFEKKYWCEYSNDYCDASECNEEICCACDYYREHHPVCELNESNLCLQPDYDYQYDGVAEACEGHCEGCIYWEEHREALKEEAEDND